MGLWVAEIFIPILSILPYRMLGLELGLGLGLGLGYEVIPLCFCGVYVALQANIAVGGHYGFFNLLAGLLALALLRCVLCDMCCVMRVV